MEKMRQEHVENKHKTIFSLKWVFNHIQKSIKTVLEDDLWSSSTSANFQSKTVQAWALIYNIYFIFIILFYF